jgi:hypothetical protein
MKLHETFIDQVLRAIEMKIPKHETDASAQAKIPKRCSLMDVEPPYSFVIFSFDWSFGLTTMIFGAFPVDQKLRSRKFVSIFSLTVACRIHTNAINFNGAFQYWVDDIQATIPQEILEDEREDES